MRTFTLALHVWVSFGYCSLYRRLHAYGIFYHRSLGRVDAVDRRSALN